MPPWSHGAVPTEIVVLLREVYGAIQVNLFWLAAMGIRSALERIIIERVKDQGNFIKNMDKFHGGGYLSERQRLALDAILEAGHAATHRGWRPSEEDINTIVDIIEHVIEDIYIHQARASDLDKTLPRRPRPKTTGN
jgi:hypothetical protein